MGIQGLLKGLDDLLVPSTSRSGALPTADRHNITQFEHKRLAIDISSWLFKAGYSDAQRLVESTEKGIIDPNCERIICNYITKRCEELILNASIRKIYLVFDGKRCPLKEGTNLEREERRQLNLSEARKLKAQGRHAEANEKYKSCIKVAAWMTNSIARVVQRKWGVNGTQDRHPIVECVFSPYEADAQLAKLCVDGLADAVVTEDSDLLVYSAACLKPFPIIFKLDRKTGACNIITMNWLLGGQISSRNTFHRVLPHNEVKSSNNGNRPIKKKGSGTRSSSLLSCLQAMVTRETCHRGAGARMFVQAAVLSGCDYAPNRLAGVGLVTAFKMIKENAYRDPSKRFYYILKGLPREKIIPVSSTLTRYDRTRGEGFSTVVDEYEDLLAKSEAVFYYNYVTDMLSQCKTVPLNSLPTGSTSSPISSGSINVKRASEDEACYPSIERFNNNISFIFTSQEGKSSKNKSHQKSNSIQHGKIQPITNCSRKDTGDLVLIDAPSSLTNPSSKDSSSTSNSFSRFACTQSLSSMSHRKRRNLSIDDSNSPTTVSEFNARNQKRQVTIESDEELDDVTSKRSVRRTFFAMGPKPESLEGCTSFVTPTSYISTMKKKHMTDDASSDGSITVEHITPSVAMKDKLRSKALRSRDNERNDQRTKGSRQGTSISSYFLRDSKSTVKPTITKKPIRRKATIKSFFKPSHLKR